MKPKKLNQSQDRLFEKRLSDQLNPSHELMIFAEVMDWESLERKFQDHFSSETGAPARPARLVIGVMLLQHMYKLSDEAVVAHWVENPYWQAFCDYDFLQWRFPIHPTTLVKWRKRIGEKGLETVMNILVDTALRTGTIRKQSLKKAIADTTVMPKAIAYPTDAKLYFNGIKTLVRFSKAHNLTLRQTYTFVSKKALRRAHQLAHARKMKKAVKEVRRLKIYLGRVFRDVFRQINKDQELRQRAAPVLCTLAQVLLQERADKDKIYSVHEPHVACIAKGKSHKKYEFGSKTSLVVTHKEGFVMSIQALKGNPYDGHTLSESLSSAERITGHKISTTFVDKGFRGHKITDSEVVLPMKKSYLKHWRKKKELFRRQAIEPHIGHMKTDGKLDRNYLKGHLGDELNALLCGIGHNMRLIINHLRLESKFCISS